LTSPSSIKIYVIQLIISNSKKQILFTSAGFLSDTTDSNTFTVGNNEDVLKLHSLIKSVKF